MIISITGSQDLLRCKPLSRLNATLSSRISRASVITQSQKFIGLINTSVFENQILWPNVRLCSAKADLSVLFESDHLLDVPFIQECFTGDKSGQRTEGFITKW